ncbi:inositol monophosphatase family protein [Corynebacterium freiburgense]|uniref:inositol monophosphatase family protein n=1 Tax=Corynebacterium freiburgense TaxID=556548 RepID=UPI00041BCDE1|nr:inositol monophosphatase family protein [Corynebacterium freiburgense]WJZ01986.1 Inositol-1-monophosphatase [Corynebacterium freiburgense]
MQNSQNLEEMIGTITKTFVIAHEADTDEHLAQALVFNAGRLAWRMRETGITTQRKTNISDVVTEADHAAEQFISGALLALRPNDGVLGEEGASRPAETGRIWVIDPIDGTYNFASGSDYFCSALALQDNGELRFGAVHRPTMGYTWFGGKHIPTTRDSQKLAPLQDTPLSEVSLGSYLHPSYMNSLSATWINVAKHAATVRMLGAGSIDLASVADGTLGAWMQHSAPAWDWLPGKALIEGAGGRCETADAGGVTWHIAGNTRAVAEILDALH